MGWTDVLEQLRPCCICHRPFHQLRYPKLLPCYHFLCCDSCLLASQSVQCPACGSTHSTVLPEQFFEQLMQYVWEFYNREDISDDDKLHRASDAHQQLEAYFANIEPIPPPDPQEAPALESNKAIQLIDFDALPLEDEAPGETWDCAVCGVTGNESSKYRCGGCDRVQFHVYQRLTGFPYALPESLQQLFADPPNAVLTEVDLLPEPPVSESSVFLADDHAEPSNEPPSLSTEHPAEILAVESPSLSLHASVEVPTAESITLQTDASVEPQPSDPPTSLTDSLPEEPIAEVPVLPSETPVDTLTTEPVLPRVGTPPAEQPPYSAETPSESPGVEYPVTIIEVLEDTPEAESPIPPADLPAELLVAGEPFRQMDPLPEEQQAPFTTDTSLSHFESQPFPSLSAPHDSDSMADRPPSHDANQESSPDSNPTDFALLPLTKLSPISLDSQWECPVCKHSSNPQAQHRCANCNRVSFPVYVSLNPESINRGTVQHLLSSEEVSQNGDMYLEAKKEGIDEYQLEEVEEAPVVVVAIDDMVVGDLAPLEPADQEESSDSESSQDKAFSGPAHPAAMHPTESAPESDAIPSEPQKEHAATPSLETDEKESEPHAPEHPTTESESVPPDLQAVFPPEEMKSAPLQAFPHSIETANGSQWTAEQEQSDTGKASASIETLKAAEPVSVTEPVVQPSAVTPHPAITPPTVSITETEKPSLVEPAVPDGSSPISDIDPNKGSGVRNSLAQADNTKSFEQVFIDSRTGEESKDPSQAAVAHPPGVSQPPTDSSVISLKKPEGEMEAQVSQEELKNQGSAQSHYNRSSLSPQQPETTSSAKNRPDNEIQVPGEVQMEDDKPLPTGRTGCCGSCGVF